MEGHSSDTECGPKKKRQKPLVSKYKAETTEVVIEFTRIKDETLECDKCDFIAMTGALLDQHTQTHNVEDTNQSNVCKFTAETSALLKEHMLHNEDETFQCDMCDFATKTAALLKEHIQTHNEENRTECDMCNFIADTAQLLKDHIQTHFQVEAYECDKCDYSSETPDLLKLHKKTQHDEDMHKCDICDVRTETATMLNEHIKTHFDETYSCDMCKFRTETAALLKDHIKTHTGQAKTSAVDQCSHPSNTRGTVGNSNGSERTPCNSCVKAEQQKKSYYNCSVDGCLNSTLNGDSSFFKLPTASERLARLRSLSSELGRSRSVTPSSERNVQRSSAARRALMMGLVREKRDIDLDMPPPPHTKNQALGVAVTPGGTVTVTGQVVHRTPGGHVRKRPNSPSIFASIEEKVEAMDLTDEEEDDAQVERWIYGPGLATPLPSNLSTAAAVNICEVSVDDSGSLSLPIASLTTTKQPGSITNVSSADDVRPSCSGVARTSKPVPKIRARNNSDLDSEYDEEYDFTKTVQTTVVDGIGRGIPDDDELEEPVRKIIGTVEEAMDEFAESLLSDSNTFIWEKNFESFRGTPEQFSGPTPGPLNNYETPYDAFSDIWTRDIIERIAEETNRYAQQTIDAMKAHESLGEKSRVHQWHNTDADEIMILFAVYILMGIDTRTSQKEYWTSCGFLTLPYLKNLMTYNRYVLLSKFLHFVDNSDVSQDYLQYEDTSMSPKLAKIAPVISHLNTKFSSLYNCCREISIDESLTLFKGRLSWVQAIRSKGARFGIKSYELCESQTGYLYKFQIYTGTGISNLNSGCDDVAPSVSLGGKSGQVVLELLKGLENRGHSVTMDNFYNSPSLARYLKSQGFDCLGTLRVNRKNVPEDIAKVPKNVAKGTIVARHCGDVSVLAWKDSKVVTMISTYHKDDTFEGSKAGHALVKPVSVDDYNRTMGGVDLKDQKLSMYLLERKRGVKWYMKIFKRLLNVSIHNAFILHLSSLIRVGKPKITHRDFRYELANSIVEHNRPALLQISEPDGKVMRLRRDIVHVPHYEAGSKTRKLCVVHQRLERKLVKTKCVTCDVFLCFEDCWEQWHSLAKLPGREVRGRKRKRDE